jgi:hypothetical protein
VGNLTGMFTDTGYVPWWQTLPEDHTFDQLVEAILADPAVDKTKTLNEIFQDHADQFANSNEGYGGTSGSSTSGDNTYQNAVVPVRDDQGNITGYQIAESGEVVVPGMPNPATGAKAGEMDLNPATISGIPIGVLQARQSMSEADIDVDALAEMGLEDYQIEFLQGLEDTPAVDDSVEDILVDTADDLRNGDTDFGDPVSDEDLLAQFQGEMPEALQEALGEDGDLLGDIAGMLGKSTEGLHQELEKIMLGDLGAGIRINGDGSASLIYTLPIPLLPPSTAEIQIRDADGNITINTETIKEHVQGVVDDIASIPGNVVKTATETVDELIKAGEQIGEINSAGDILDIAGNVIGTIFSEDMEGILDSDIFDTGKLIGDIVEQASDELDLKYEDGWQFNEELTVPDGTVITDGPVNVPIGEESEDPIDEAVQAVNNQHNDPVIAPPTPVGWAGEGNRPQEATNQHNDPVIAPPTPVGWAGEGDAEDVVREANNQYNDPVIAPPTPVGWAGEGNTDTTEDQVREANNQYTDPVIAPPTPVGWAGQGEDEIIDDSNDDSTTDEEDPVGGGGGDGGGGASSGGGAQTNSGYMGGLSYQLQAPRSVIYDPRDPMAQLDDIINRSLFKGII